MFVVCTVIWFATGIGSGGGLGYFWPVWLLIPMVLGALGRIGSGYDDRGRNRHRDRDRRRNRDDR